MAKAKALALPALLKRDVVELLKMKTSVTGEIPQPDDVHAAVTTLLYLAGLEVNLLEPQPSVPAAQSKRTRKKTT